MKSIFTLLVVLFAAQSFSQNFHFEPTDELNKTINTDNISDLHIDIIRETTVDTLYLAYELITNTLPEDWYVGYCDNHGCWGSLPESGVMSPCYGDLNSYIKLSIGPNNVEGSGTVQYFVYEVGHYEDGLLMTFNVDTPGYVGIEETSQNSLNIYPNPAQNFIQWQSDSELAQLSIYSMTGQLLEEYRNLNTINQIDISYLNNGIYLIKTLNKSGESFTQKLKKF